MKRILRLLIADATGGNGTNETAAPSAPAAPAPVAAAPETIAAAQPPQPVDLVAEIAAIQAKIAQFKTLPPTGQLQIAIGALGTAADFLGHHVAITTPAKKT